MATVLSEHYSFLLSYFLRRRRRRLRRRCRRRNLIALFFLHTILLRDRGEKSIRNGYSNVGSRVRDALSKIFSLEHVPNPPSFFTSITCM